MGVPLLVCRVAMVYGVPSTVTGVSPLSWATYCSAAAGVTWSIIPCTSGSAVIVAEPLFDRIGSHTRCDSCAGRPAAIVAEPVGLGGLWPLNDDRLQGKLRELDPLRGQAFGVGRGGPHEPVAVVVEYDAERRPIRLGATGREHGEIVRGARHVRVENLGVTGRRRSDDASPSRSDPVSTYAPAASSS